MKYIKTYEKNFNIGDYIKLIESDKIKHLFKVVKIIKADKDFNEYDIETIINNDRIRFKILVMNSPLIERLATPEEIEEYEALKSSIKYNL